MLSRILIFLLQAYRLTLSSVLGNRCRYYPSCSAYGIEAIEKHGPIKGTWLTTKRGCRCHPFAEGGIDHVPEPTSELAPEPTPLKKA